MNRLERAGVRDGVFDNRLQSAVRHQSKRGRYQLDLRLQGSEKCFGTLRKVGAFRLQQLAVSRLICGALTRKRTDPTATKLTEKIAVNTHARDVAKPPGFRRTHLSRARNDRRERP